MTNGTRDGIAATIGFRPASSPRRCSAGASRNPHKQLALDFPQSEHRTTFLALFSFLRAAREASTDAVMRVTIKSKFRSVIPVVTINGSSGIGMITFSTLTDSVLPGSTLPCSTLPGSSLIGFPTTCGSGEGLERDPRIVRLVDRAIDVNIRLRLPK